jgi:hypothetical protein
MQLGLESQKLADQMNAGKKLAAKPERLLTAEEPDKLT